MVWYEALIIGLGLLFGAYFFYMGNPRSFVISHSFIGRL